MYTTSYLFRRVFEFQRPLGPKISDERLFLTAERQKQMYFLRGDIA